MIRNCESRDRHDPAPVLERNVVKSLHRIDSGVVDEDVASAKARFGRPRQRGDFRGLADVAANGERLAARELHHFNGFVGCLTIDDDDIGAVLGKTLGVGLTDAHCGAGDERDLSLKTLALSAFAQLRLLELPVLDLEQLSATLGG